MKIEETKLTKNNVKFIEGLRSLQKLDEYKPNIHLMPYSGLLNDPNGLCYINGKFHIFYQWFPFCAKHGLKHWAHYSTEDFVNFKHHKTAIIPTIKEENAGVYTGATLVEDDEAYIYYTGNIENETWEGRDKDSATILVKMDKNGTVSKEKKILFYRDREHYSYNFRDPFPFKKDGKYWLLHGAQSKDRKGLLSLYSSDYIDKDFKLVGDIKFSRLERLGRMVECPNYFKSGKYDVLMFSPNKMDPYLETDEKPVFVLGYLEDPNDLLFYDIERYQFVDYGFEFYAPQVLIKGDRVIMIGWFGQVRLDPYPNLKYQWANILTIPREVTTKDRWVFQNPIKEMEGLREKTQQLSRKGFYPIQKNYSYELLVDNITNEDFNISLENEEGEKVELVYKNDKFYFLRDKMSLPFYPEFGDRRSIKGIKVFDIRVYFDVSAMELYINKGEYTMTGRYFVKNATKIILNTTGKATMYRLNNLNITFEPLL